MNIHEYQAKELLRGYGVSVLQGFAAWTPEEAAEAAAKLPGPVYVVKSQIHAGGRGAGHFKDDPQGKGGVRLARSADEVRAAAEAMIGHTLVTKQTGPGGRDVRRVYVEAGCDIDRELYLSLLVDRDTSRVLVMASTEGGMEVEEVAAHSPEKILRVAVDPATGIFPYHARKLAFGLGLTGKQTGAFARFVDAMYKAFVALDCAIVEVNPLVVTKSGDVVALDAKVSFDDNALYRHSELAALRDEAEEDPKELEAARFDLNYVALDGVIGCMVNGAGLAMATMDIIKLVRRQPRRTSWTSEAAPIKRRSRPRSKIILKEPNAEGHLGPTSSAGIMKCDIIAEARHRGLARARVCRCRWWCAWKAPTWKSARTCWPNRAWPIILRPTTWPTRPRRSSAAVKGAKFMSILVDKNTTRHLPGLHRQRKGTFHSEQAIAYGTKMMGGITPGKGGTTHLEPAGVRHRARSPVTKKPAPTRSAIYVPPPFAADAILEAIEAGNRPDRLHHRRHPGAGHGARSSARCRARKSVLVGPELPGRDHARRMQDRHHAWPYPSPAAPWASSGALRHAHL